MAAILLLALVWGLPQGAQAQVVGRITQMEGRVDVLKGGKLPATPAKVDDSLQVGDVVRTKSLSKAQLTFMDNSVVTISPESRLAIEEYMFDPAQGKRSAVLQMFQGLAHVVVTKLFKVQDPDFLVKTHTAVMGVRGTEIGLRLHPNASTIMNFEGLTQVANIFPEVGDAIFNKVKKVAFTFPAGSVMLKAMQGTTVARGLPPTLPFQISAEDKKQFMGQLSTGLVSRKGGKDTGAGTGAQARGGGAGGTGTGGTGGTGTTGTDTGATGTDATLAGATGAIGTTGGTTGIEPLAGATDTTLTTGGGGLDTGSSTTSSFSTLAFDSTLATGSTTGTSTGTVTTDTAALNLITATSITNTGISGTGTTAGDTGLVVQDTGSGGIGGSGSTGGSTSGGSTSGGSTSGGSTTGGSTTPTSGTYSFTSSSYTAWTTTPVSSTVRNITSNGWGQRTWTNADSTLLGWLGATNQTYSMGDGPGVATTYYSSTSSGTRTLQSYSSYGGPYGTGTAYGTTLTGMYGTVTGTPGVTDLTGSGVVTGTDSRGNNVYFSGNITINKTTGIMTFNYAGDLRSYQQYALGTGTTYQVPGTYFAQTMTGLMTTSSSSPYWATNILGTYYAGGTRYAVLPGNFVINWMGGAISSGSSTYAETSPWNYSFLPYEAGSMTDEDGTPNWMEGAVSSMDYQGIPLVDSFLGPYYQGAMTMWPGNYGAYGFYYQNNNLSWLQPALFYDAYYNLFKFQDIYDPYMVATVSLNNGTTDAGRMFGTVYYSNLRGGSYTNGLVNFSTLYGASPTPAPTADYVFSQTYNGSFFLNTVYGSEGSPSTTQMQTFSMGWGQRSSPEGTYYVPGTYNPENGTGTPIAGAPAPVDSSYSPQSGYYFGSGNGTWNLTSGTLPAARSYPVMSAVTQMGGTLTGTLGQNLTGLMTFSGSLLGGTSFSYSGPATMSSDGFLSFEYGSGTYNNGTPYSSNWAKISGGSGTATGWMDMNPGYRVTQTFNNVPYTVGSSTGYTATLNLGGAFAGSLNFYDDTGRLPALSGGSATIGMDGVFGATEFGGARYGASTLSVSGLSALSGSNPLILPGIGTSLTPGGNPFFQSFWGQPLNALNSNLNMGNSGTGVANLAAGNTAFYTLFETFNGFRLRTATTPLTLAYGEGYGWGLRGTGTTASVNLPTGGTQAIALPTGFTLPTSALALPSSYLSPYISQSLSTYAAAPGQTLQPNWVISTGTLAGTFTGSAGGTLTGKVFFSGTTSTGSSFNYQGPATLTADGKLLLYYYGSFTTSGGSSTMGSSSGQMYQLPGTYFTQTASGSYLQSSTSASLGSGNTLFINNMQDAAPLTGSRTEYTYNPSTGSYTTSSSSLTASFAGSQTVFGTTNPYPSGGSGTVSSTMTGVVANAPKDPVSGAYVVDRFGVATTNATYTPSGGSPTNASITGPVLIETNTVLLGQSVNQTSPSFTTTLNVKSSDVAATGVATTSFVKTATGNYTQTIDATGSSQTAITPTALTGTTSTAAFNPAMVTSPTTAPAVTAPTTTNLTITSSAAQAGTYTTAAGPITVNSVGVAGGTPGGAMSGLSSTTVVKTNTSTGTTSLGTFVGGATVTPTTVAVTTNGINLAPGGVGAIQSGTVTTTKP